MKRSEFRFSLLEVMVAMFIFASSSLLILAGFRGVMKNITLSGEYDTAQQLAENKAQEYISSPDIKPGKTSGSFDGYKKYKWEVAVSRKEGTGYYSVITTVKFDSFGEKRDIIFTSGRILISDNKTGKKEEENEKR